MYEYNAQVVRVIDGDTIRLAIDLGFETTSTQNLRISRIDAPERYTEAGKKAIEFAQTLLPVDGWVSIKTYRIPDKYGRYIAEITDANGNNFSDLMLESGHASPSPWAPPRQ